MIDYLTINEEEKLLILQKEYFENKYGILLSNLDIFLHKDIETAVDTALYRLSLNLFNLIKTWSGDFNTLWELIKEDTSRQIAVRSALCEQLYYNIYSNSDITLVQKNENGVKVTNETVMGILYNGKLLWAGTYAK